MKAGGLKEQSSMRGKHISSNLRSARMAKYVTHLRQSLKSKIDKEVCNV